MRKLKLLMAICALFVGGGNLAWADPNPGDDMTSYITNPTFTDNADGWTITGQARYYNGKGFDGTTNFIELTKWESSWDATISQTVTSLPNGYYQVQAAAQMSNASDLWMKLVANGAESYFSRNGDTNGNILANGTETTIGSGVAGWRYTRVIAKVTDGTLEISCVGHSDTNARWANFDAVTLTFLGTEIAPGSDVTEFISNWDFWGCFNDSFNGWTIDKDGGNSWVHGNTAIEHWCDNHARYFDYYQTVTGLPDGRYTLSASMWNTQGTPNGNSGVYATNNSSVTVFAGVTDDCGDSDLHTYTTDGIFVNDGKLRVGVKNNGARSTNWFGVDWIKMTYIGKVVQDYAEELPAGGAMAADTWYYLDIAVAGDNYNATATDLSKIICTTDGYTLTSATTGGVTLVAENNSLSVARYYVKSVGAANNLVVAPASYTYTVGSATADKAYIQPGNTVTVSYQDLVTSNPGAVLTKDFSGVTFDGDAITVTPTSNGFTFEVPSGLAVGTAFTLAIPANAIGYAVGSTYNEAQNITLTTPAIYDGIYYFYNNYTQKYLSRGRNWGTQALMDDYGVPAFLEFDGEGKTRVKFFDNYKYLSSDGWLFADNATGGQFYVEKVVGGYKIKDAAINKYVAVYDDYAVGDALESDNSSVWALETPAEYAAKDNATTLANAQAVAAATSAGIIGITSFADLESELSSNYGETSIAITGAKAEKYNVNAGSDPLVESKYVEETVNGLKPGLYRLTVDAFQRASSNQRVAEAGGANSLVYVYAGSAKTQIKSVMAYGANAAYSSDFEYNGLHYPNNEASAYTALATGNYKNVVYVYVADEGEGTGSLTFGINNPQNTNAGGYPNALWAVYDNFTLTYYEPKATASEKTALSDAITAAEAKTLGFETGEYAPYNNVDALTKLAAAKAINSESASGTSVVAATTALTGATWTANAAEVNGIYDGDFAIQPEHTTGPTVLAGWNNPEGIRQLIKNTETDPGLSSASAQAAVFAWGNTTMTYGNVTGYTIPLKANTVYELSFKTCGWRDGDMGYVKVTLLNTDSEGMSEQTTATATKRVNVANPWDEFRIVFVTGKAGNYKLGMWTSKHTVFTDLMLKKAASQVLEFADGSLPKYAPGTYPSVKITRTLTADKWATAVYPFAVSGVDKIVVLDAYDKATGALNFSTAAASTANVPFLMKSTTDKSAITLSNVAVAAAAVTNATAAEASLVGTYAVKGITNAEKNYVLSNNTIYPVGTAGATINPYRAYIQVAQDAPARLSIVVDGEETNSIHYLSADLSDGEGVVYNLNGQKVQNVKNGVFVKNGKKVVVR